MSRFVILRHETPRESPRPLHWDFMLERGTILRTWALPQPPKVGQSTIGDALADHRTEYLELEGPVSGNRGHVERWDRGDYELIEEDHDRLVVRLAGSRFHGTVTIRRQPDKPSQWRFSFGD